MKITNRKKEKKKKENNMTNNMLLLLYNKHGRSQSGPRLQSEN